MQAQLRMLMPDEMNARLAGAAVDAASRGPVTPIPLTAAGNRTVGVIYDRFLQGAAAARAQAAAGSTVTPDAIASHPVWQGRLTVVVAYPMSCDGKPNQPLAIRFGGGMGPVPPTLEGEAIRGRDAAGLLPGVTLPDEALVAAFRNAFPRQLQADPPQLRAARFADALVPQALVAPIGIRVDPSRSRPSGHRLP